MFPWDNDILPATVCGKKNYGKQKPNTKLCNITSKLLALTKFLITIVSTTRYFGVFGDRPYDAIYSHSRGHARRSKRERHSSLWLLIVYISTKGSAQSNFG